MDDPSPFPMRFNGDKQLWAHVPMQLPHHFEKANGNRKHGASIGSIRTTVE